MMKEKNKNKSFIKEVIIIIVVGLIINLACFFMDSLSVKAASAEEYYPIQNGYNPGNKSVNLTFIEQQFQDPTVIFIYAYGDPNSSYPNRMRYSIIHDNNNNGLWNIYAINITPHSFTLYADNTYSSNFTYDTGLDWGDGRPVDVYSTGNSNGLNAVRNVDSTIYNNNNIFYSRESVHFNSVDSGNICIFVPQATNNPTTTDFTNSPLITGHAIPSQPTAPTFTPPTYDSNLSFVENVKVYIQWLGQYIGTLFTWLLQSIYDYLDSLLQNIKAFINAVITAINNGFMNIFQNFQSLISPFFAFFTAFAQVIEDFLTDFNTNFVAFVRQQISNIVSGISRLVDSVISIYNFLFGTKGFFDTYGVIWNQETWEETLEDSDWLDAVSDNTTTLSQFINGTLNVAEPQELVFTFDFRNAYYNFGLCTFDMSWYQPYKHGVRLAFLSICVLNVVLYFFDEAPNWFSGGGSNKKGDK